jgi:tRNA1Val (adenine37-N6)-methyltransferase
MHFHLVKKISVTQTPAHNYFRSILIFSRKSVSLKEETLLIKNEQGNYSEAFIQLLKEYYLYL